MAFECQYCKSVFSGKHGLVSHQKSAKYCLVPRNVQLTEYPCKTCNKKFTRESTLVRHTIKCQEKAKEKVDLENKFIEMETKYKTHIEELEKNLEDQRDEYEKQIRILQELINPNPTNPINPINVETKPKNIY